MRATSDKLSPWVEKSACGRDLDTQLAAVATSGQHGAPQVLRAMALGANGFAAAPPQAELALVASIEGTVVADARCVIDASGDGAEFGLMVAQGWRRRGLASRCLDALASAAATVLTAAPAHLSTAWCTAQRDSR